MTCKDSTKSPPCSDIPVQVCKGLNRDFDNGCKCNRGYYENSKKKCVRNNKY